MNEILKFAPKRAVSTQLGAEVRMALIASKQIRETSARRPSRGFVLDEIAISSTACEILAALGPAFAADVAMSPHTDPRVAVALSGLLAMPRAARDPMIARAKRRVSWAPPSEDRDPAEALEEFLRRKN
ncbi:MAG TPA: hypothetical protein VHW01_18345 [Polyangiaceae bacterium]|jgi:hypothetical protein|nr:hypothetical protein [Polyangiaceae bacterium]